MPANFAPVCVRIDLESFGGPAHYVHRFRNGVGWLIMARATEADGPREAFIAAACDEYGHHHPSFQVAHLLDCAWSLPEPCDGYAPDELEEMLGEEHGALALRWLRADYRELRQADEASEIALARQEKQTKARIDRIDRHLADLRRRRRSQDMTVHNLATIDTAIIELSDLRDRETAAFARARRALRAETAEMEEHFLLQSGLRVELEVTLVAHWRACVTQPVRTPRVLWQGGTHGRHEAGWLYAHLDDPEAQARRNALAFDLDRRVEVVLQTMQVWPRPASSGIAAVPATESRPAEAKTFPDPAPARIPKSATKAAPTASQKAKTATTLMRLEKQVQILGEALTNVEQRANEPGSLQKYWDKRRSMLKKTIDRLTARRAAMVLGQE